MQHYLIRHAHAVDLTPDAIRPLSGKGRAQVGRLGEFLRGKKVLVPDEIWHSPLLRAKETAVMIAQVLSFTGPVREVSGLEPEADPNVIARLLVGSGHSIAVVGHEPHLGGLASILIGGHGARPVVHMKKCAALAIEGGGAYWQVGWHLAPELFV